MSPAGRPIGWVVRTSQLDEVARRLNLPIHAGSRTAPGGTEVRWRTAGIDQAAAEPSLPFFIEWDAQTQHPGRANIRHRGGDVRIDQLALSGDPVRLAVWLGDHQLPIVVREGKPAVPAIYLSGDTGDGATFVLTDA
jgi:hypothetical protein